MWVPAHSHCTELLRSLRLLCLGWFLPTWTWGSLEPSALPGERDSAVSWREVHQSVCGHMSQTPKQLIRILRFREKGSEALPGSYFLKNICLLVLASRLRECYCEVLGEIVYSRVSSAFSIGNSSIRRICPFFSLNYLFNHLFMSVGIRGPLACPMASIQSHASFFPAQIAQLWNGTSFRSCLRWCPLVTAHLPPPPPPCTYFLVS